MTLMRWTLAAVCGVTMLVAPAIAAEAPVAFQDGWVREAPPTAKVMGAYVTIRNTSDHEIVLQRVASPDFTEIQMHVTYREEGRMGMRQVKNFKIPAGKTLELKPGGAHLMLMQPTRILKSGDRLALAFDFGPDGVVTHELPVHSARDRRPAASPSPHAHGEHHDHGDHGHHH